MCIQPIYIISNSQGYKIKIIIDIIFNICKITEMRYKNNCYVSKN